MAMTTCRRLDDNRRIAPVVDLTRYRQLTEQAAQSPCLEWSVADCYRRDEDVTPARRRTRPARRQAPGLFWDACASMGILVMTLTVTLRVLAM